MMSNRINNGLLRHLAKAAPDTFARVADELEPVPLERWTRLCRAHERPRWAYFPESGLVSLVGATAEGESVEVAFVGNEGVAGVADVLGARSMPFTLIVQLPGLAYRLPSAVAKQHVFSCTALHDLLMAHAQSMILQLAQSAICNRFHTAVQRLSRWLFLTSGRAETDRFELTHDFVAEMVGGPRTAVSQAAATLRRNGIIDYERGVIIIRDRTQLHRMACECADAFAPLIRRDGIEGSSPAVRSVRRGRAKKTTVA
jgi:CRP-like cAMP-binding protein